LKKLTFYQPRKKDVKSLVQSISECDNNDFLRQAKISRASPHFLSYILLKQNKKTFIFNFQGKTKAFVADIYI